MNRYRLLIVALVIAVLSLAALAVRAWKFYAIGLSHFDEGVYTNSGFWALPSFFGPGLDPWQKFFSPPGYFGLVGLLYRLLGHPSELAAIAVNVIGRFQRTAPDAASIASRHNSRNRSPSTEPA